MVIRRQLVWLDRLCESEVDFFLKQMCHLYKLLSWFVFFPTLFLATLHVKIPSCQSVAFGKTFQRKR